MSTVVAHSFTAEESRRNAAGVLRKMDFEDAAIALEMPLEGATDEERAWIARNLSEAMNEVDEDGRAVIGGWVRNTMRTTKNQATQPKAEMLLGWLIQNVESAMVILGTAVGAPDRVKELKIQRAKDLVERVQFPGYVLACIDWMAASASREDNYISGLIVLYPEMAEVINMENGRANRIIQILRQPAEEALAQVHRGPMRAGKTERDHEKAKENRKALRAKRDAEYRNSMKGHNPAADKHGKGKSK